MEVFSWEDVERGSLKLRNKLTALTVGGFDGPHRGHEALFSAVRSRSIEGLVPGVVTFKSPPRFTIAPVSPTPPSISTVAQRLCRFKEAGFAFTVLIDFSHEFSTMDGEQFFSFLYNACNARFFAEGKDFRFGYRGCCGVEDMRRFAAYRGVALTVPDEVLHEGERISSSRIRCAISEGNFPLVHELLGYNFELDCEQMIWEEEVGALVSAMPFSQLLPRDGSYAVRLHSKEKIIDTRLFTERDRLRIPQVMGANTISAIEFVP